MGTVLAYYFLEIELFSRNRCTVSADDITASKLNKVCTSIIDGFPILHYFMFIFSLNKVCFKKNHVL